MILQKLKLTPEEGLPKDLVVGRLYEFIRKVPRWLNTNRETHLYNGNQKRIALVEMINCDTIIDRDTNCEDYNTKCGDCKKSCEETIGITKGRYQAKRILKEDEY